jgi:hypothetical protein
MSYFFLILARSLADLLHRHAGIEQGTAMAQATLVCHFLILYSPWQIPISLTCSSLLQDTKMAQPTLLYQILFWHSPRQSPSALMCSSLMQDTKMAQPTFLYQISFRHKSLAEPYCTDVRLSTARHKNGTADTLILNFISAQVLGRALLH